MSFFEKLFGKNKTSEDKTPPLEETKKEKEKLSVRFQMGTLDIDGLPFELMINTVLEDRSLRIGFTWFWIITLQSFDNGQEGLPRKEEREKLMKLMQEIVQKIIKEHEIQIVGTSFHKGSYDVMFYSREADHASIGGLIAEMPEYLEDVQGRFVNFSGTKEEEWKSVKGYFDFFSQRN